MSNVPSPRHVAPAAQPWNSERLDSVAQRGSGHTPDKKHPEYWNGAIKWISLKDSDRLDNLYICDTEAKITPAGIANSSAVEHPEGTVVLSRDAGVGKSAITKDVMAVSQHFMAWQCGPRLNNHFLYYWLQLKKPEFERIASGNTIKTIGLPYFKALTIPIPAPEEQRAIAAVLVDMDTLLDALSRLIAKKRDLKQAAMQQLLTGRTRLPGFKINAGYKRTEVGNVPIDWEVRPLLSAVRVPNGQVDPRVEPYRSMTLVAPDHIERATGRLLARHSAADQKAISGKYLFSAGDIVYSKIRPYLRKAIVVNFDGLCSADMYPLKPAAGISAEYMLAVLLGHSFSTFAESVSVRSGMPKINRAELAKYKLAFPTSEEQQAIAEVFTDMDGEISGLEQRRDKTRRLKQGMMQELLTGRTRLL